jgi:phospho-N-acetylmuramoyl-pentapeptide-transferase
MKNIRTPLHDHVRKVSGWSNTQTVFRFAIIQIVLSAAVIYGIR